MFGALHAAICSLPRVNDIAVGIALMLFGTGLAFYLGKPLVQPRAPTLPALPLGFWSDIPQVRAALEVNGLFIVGLVMTPALRWALANTRWGLIVRMVGDSAEAARALGYSPIAVRLYATCFGGFMAGVGGSFLSLYYPGSWNEGLSSGQGITAVALVIFARWNPIACFGASLLFGGAGALGPALQAVGVTSGTYLLNAASHRWRARRAQRHQVADRTKGTRHVLRRRRSLSLAVRRPLERRRHRADHHRHADRFLRRRRLRGQDGL